MQGVLERNGLTGGGSMPAEKGSHLRLRTKLPPFDPTLFITTVLLCGGGIPMLYSASYAVAMQHYNSPSYFVLRQLFWGLAGGATMLWLSRVDLARFRAAVPGLFVLSLVLLSLVYTPLGVEMGHVRRWVRIPPLPPFQPSEIAKVTLVAMLAHYLAGEGTRTQQLRASAGKALTYVGVVVALVLPEPHLSASMLFLLIGLTMVFLAGVPMRRIGMVLLLCATLGLLAHKFALKPYQKERLDKGVASWWTGIVDPTNPSGGDYQTTHATTALRRGGLRGVGFCNGREKHLYLPAPHTDFIFAVIGEELGLLGTLTALLLFALLVFRGFEIAHSCTDPFCGLLCAGLTMLLAYHAFVNIAVATKCMLNTGMTLPFISSGGSALVTSMASVGLMMAVSRRPDARTDPGDWQ